jgi:hypothetical protein
VRVVPRLCELHPGICLTTEKKARKNISYGSRKVSQYRGGSCSTHSHTNSTQSNTVRQNIQSGIYKTTQLIFQFLPYNKRSESPLSLIISWYWRKFCYFHLLREIGHCLYNSVMTHKDGKSQKVSVRLIQVFVWYIPWNSNFSFVRSALRYLAWKVDKRRENAPERYGRLLSWSFSNSFECQIDLRQ